MDCKVCKPALIYLVIALIMLCIAVLLKLDTFSLSAACSQLCGIMICTLLLIGLCATAPKLTWILTILLITCTISASIIMTMNYLIPPMI